MQSSLLVFFTVGSKRPSTSKSDDIKVVSEKRKKKEVDSNQKKEYEDERRAQKFLPLWRTSFPWLDNNNNTGMFCKVCRDHSTKADMTGSFFLGTKSYRKQTIVSHHESIKHKMCMEAEANKDSQIETAIAEEQRLAAKLINDAEIER